MGFSKAHTYSFPPLYSRSRKHARSENGSIVYSDIKPDNDILMPQRKRVRFDTNVKTFHVPASKSAHFDFLIENKAQFWWTFEERQDISENAQQTALRFRKHNVDEVNHYLDIFDQCSKAPSQSTSEYLENATISIPTDVRGLERGIFPSVKEHRRGHIKEVLDVQEHIRGRLSPEMWCQVLGMRSVRSSRPSRVMARLVGEGDACNV